MFIGDKFEKIEIATIRMLLGLFIFDVGNAYASLANEDAQLNRTGSIDHAADQRRLFAGKDR